MARRSAASSGGMATCLLICQLSCLTHSELHERLFENCLRLEKRFDAVGAKFTANAGILESAERRLLIVKHAVDRDATGLDLRGHPAGALYVGPVHEGVEAEARVVGDPDRIFLGFIGNNREDGPENLLPGNCHVVLHIDKDRGLHEVTRFETVRTAQAANQHLGAFFDALADVGLHALVLLLGHHRSDSGLWISRIADWKGGAGIDDRPLDFVEPTLGHEKPSPRSTSLAAVEER